MLEIISSKQPETPEILDSPEELLELEIAEIVIKVHEGCDLDCNYCYVYNMEDKEAKERNKLMREETLIHIATRLAEYLGRIKPKTFTITFHGGEPLLAPPEFYETAVSLMRDAVFEVSPDTHLIFNMHSNLNRLGKPKHTELENVARESLADRYLKVFRDNRICVSTSLDGDEEANDRHRRDKRGRSTYHQTVEGIKRLALYSQHRNRFLGILAVIDTRNDSAKTYKALSRFVAPVDPLLPLGNYTRPPRGLETEESRRQATYGKWLAAFYDAREASDIKVPVRTFKNIEELLKGGKSQVENIGQDHDKTLIVIQANGDYELVDTLSSVPGYPAKIGLNVKDHTLDQANRKMAEKAHQLGIDKLPTVCQSCPIVKICGNGYPSTRYSKERKFNNRSIYCESYAYLISHIQGRRIGRVALKQGMSLEEAEHYAKIKTEAMFNSVIDNIKLHEGQSLLDTNLNDI